MKLSMRKVKAITSFKTVSMLKNLTILLAPLMAIMMTMIMKALLPQTQESEGTVSFSTDTYALMFGVFFNVVMGAIMMGAYPLAEEKEKHTLRVLMTSSVNSVEYFIGTIIPSLGIIVIVNLLLLPLSGVHFSPFTIGIYLIYTVLISVISLMIGFIIGMVSKNQMQAGLVGTPAMLVFTMLPMFRVFNETLAKISSYVYSGVFATFIDASVTADGTMVSIHNMAVLGGWFILLVCLFMYIYKRNGLEQD